MLPLNTNRHPGLKRLCLCFHSFNSFDTPRDSIISLVTQQTFINTKNTQCKLVCLYYYIKFTGHRKLAIWTLLSSSTSSLAASHNNCTFSESNPIMLTIALCAASEAFCMASPLNLTSLSPSSKLLKKIESNLTDLL